MQQSLDVIKAYLLKVCAMPDLYAELVLRPHREEKWTGYILVRDLRLDSQSSTHYCRGDTLEEMLARMAREVDLMAR